MFDPQINIYAGWLAMLGGVSSGAAMGVFFHRSDWLGGYHSYRRRLIRLGHISFFGLGFLNMLFASFALPFYVDETAAALASICLVVGLATMPVCCFLTAWRPRARFLFPVPVVSVMAGILAVLLG